MALNELLTQFKIIEMTLRDKEDRSIIKQNKESAFFNSLRSAPVNPFLTMMYYRTSFKSWQSHVRQIVRKSRWEKEVDIDRLHYKTLGKTFIEPEFPEVKKALEEV